jgi:putative phosphoribosyl transferase
MGGVRFADRTDAGRRLGQLLRQTLRTDEGRLPTDLVVIGLPRGGVPVAAEVATALGAPLDVLLVHKIGVPFNPELAMGAVGDNGYRVIDEHTVRWAGVSPEDLERAVQRELEQLTARGRRLRRGRAPLSLRGRTAVVVDDGAATGLTALAACHLARAAGASRVVAAMPVASREAAASLRTEADEVICVDIPRSFMAVGEWYEHFGQTGESEVLELLDRAWATAPPPADDGAGGGEERMPDVPIEVRVPVGGLELAGTLVPPRAGGGIVLFAHGSGSSRHSPRNRFVAQILQEAGLGTLLFDLLTAKEDGDRSLVFDVDLLARRLLGATAWVISRDSGVPAGTPVGYFGASTGAAAALVAAARPAAETGVEIGAVVSRGGRPDLAGRALGAVRAPTLLIVGSYDTQVLALNRSAQAELRCESRLDVVRGATHLFEEPGTLAEAAALARDWFAGHLGGPPDAA